MGPEALGQVLRPLKETFLQGNFPDLLIGLDAADDAAVYRMGEDRAVIFTVDFFTPVVDDPYSFGAISAANAMSDVYAMGGEVKLALNICCFPPKLPTAVISEILRGGAEKVFEAGAVIAGGHTVADDEPKYGLAVIGEAHPDRILTKGGAKCGDVLILTKPLGTGVITTALKGGVADNLHIEAAVKWMSMLNRKASAAFRNVEVHACTDITGFSFLGHAWQIADQSRVMLRIDPDSLPFIEGAEKYCGDWLFPAGSCRNEAFYKPHVRFDDNIPAEKRMLLFTPETSGGLLAAVASGDLARIKNIFDHEKIFYSVIGEALEGEGVEVVARKG